MPNQFTELKNEIDAKKDTIKKLLEDNYSVSEICRIMDYKYSSVYNCICRNDMKHLVSVDNIGKSRTARKRYDDYNEKHALNRETLYKLYVIDKKDLYEIAEMFNFSPSGVLFRMNSLGIETRSKQEASKIMYEKKPELRDVHRRNANMGLTGVFKKGNNYSNTKIEQAFEKFCVDNHIPYERSFQITVDTHRYDFLIYDKMIVELDGLYWHNKEKQKIKDRLHEEYAIKNGFEIVRFTDKEIKETKGLCFERIKRHDGC
jgi:very-short-patch-repair endonuclease/DNA-binding CsgD family transcriptional regulator